MLFLNLNSFNAFFFFYYLFCFCLFELQHRHSLKVYERPEFGEVEKLIKIAVFIVSSS